MARSLRAATLSLLLLTLTSTHVLWLLEYYAQAYGVPFAPLARLIACESGYDPYAVGDEGRSIGPGQWYCAPGNCFWLDTPAGRDGVLRSDVAANVEMVAWVYANRPGWMHRWSCWRG